MMIRDLIEKAVIKGERLSEEERIFLLDWFSRAENVAAPANPVTGQISIPTVTQNEINAMVQQAFTSSMQQYFPRLSDITHVLGLQIAGEFRTGNGQAPGDGFTGGRFGYPGFTYGGKDFFLVGVENDTLQVGLSLDDGQVYAGGGNVKLDSQGVRIANSATSWFNFEDANGNYGTINIAADPNNDLEIVNFARSPAGLISFFLKDTAGTTRLPLRLYEHPGVANLMVVAVRGPNTRMEFLNGEGIVHIIDPTGTTYFNERNDDVDVNIQGTTDDNLTYWDASLNAVGIGTSPVSSHKLKVGGSVNIAGNLDVTNGNVRSFISVNLADDTADAFTPERTVGGMIIIASTGTGNGGFAGYNAVTGTAGAAVSGANFAATNGALTGTTGADGKLTVSAHSDGKIYIENRTGATRNFIVLLI